MARLHNAPPLSTRDRGMTIKEIVATEFWAIWRLRERGVKWVSIAAFLRIKERTLIETWFRLVEAYEAGEFKPRRLKGMWSTSSLAPLWEDVKGIKAKAFKSQIVRDNFDAISKARGDGHSWEAIGEALRFDGETARRLWQRLGREGQSANQDIKEDAFGRLQGLSKQNPLGRRRAVEKP